MTKYEKFFMEPFDGVVEEYIAAYFDGNNAKTFPAREDSPDYQAYIAYLAEQETK